MGYVLHSHNVSNSLKMKSIPHGTGGLWNWVRADKMLCLIKLCLPFGVKMASIWRGEKL